MDDGGEVGGGSSGASSDGRRLEKERRMKEGSFRKLETSAVIALAMGPLRPGFPPEPRPEDGGCDFTRIESEEFMTAFAVGQGKAATGGVRIVLFHDAGTEPFAEDPVL